MKAGVPALNALVSALYILLTALVAYWLKLSHKKRVEAQQSLSEQQQTAMRKEVNFDRLFALSWFKKYSLVGACLNDNRKYLLKELFILSVYAVTCLKINHVIVWPVAFALFLVPLAFATLDTLVGVLERWAAEEEGKNKNQTVNNVHQNQIEVEAVNIEISRPQSIKPTLRERSLPEVLMVAIFTFLTFILFYQTIFTLTNSVSNSGQLNIVSLIFILLIDQLAIRVGLGLLAFAVLKLLHKFEKIDFANNSIVNCLCQEELIKVFIVLSQERLRRELENTASHLNHRQSTEAMKQEIKLDCGSSENNVHLNLINLQPETLSCNGNDEHNENEHEDDLERQIYLTTPEKELFEGHEEQESVKERSILHELIDNKQNETVNNELNKSTLKSHQESKGLEDIISSKDDPINDMENFKTDFNLEHSREEGRGGKKGKKKAKRVLKLTGNSPYLEYLPNMLKNIDKVKNAQKDKKML